MSFLPMTGYDDLDDAAKAAGDAFLAANGGEISNTTSTLLGHLPSFTAYTQWYTLKDELAPYIGERAVSLFSYAISDESNSLVCSAFFRKILVDSGENVDDPQVTPAEQLLMDWGRLIARSPAEIPDEMYAELEQTFNPKLRLILVAFAGQMVAATVFNSAGRIPLDASLLAYRTSGDERSH